MSKLEVRFVPKALAAIPNTVSDQPALGVEDSQPPFVSSQVTKTCACKSL